MLFLALFKNDELTFLVLKLHDLYILIWDQIFETLIFLVIDIIFRPTCIQSFLHCGLASLECMKIHRDTNTSYFSMYLIFCNLCVNLKAKNPGMANITK